MFFSDVKVPTSCKMVGNFFSCFNLQTKANLCFWGHNMRPCHPSFQLRLLDWLTFLSVTHISWCFWFVRSGQGLPDDVQHVSSPLLVDGAWPRLPGDAGAGLSHGPWRPSRHHRLWVSPRLPVHRGAELGSADPPGCKYQPRALFDGAPTVSWVPLPSCPPRQLFGLVYSCYVTKVFQDDEDSCEWFLPLFHK